MSTDNSDPPAKSGLGQFWWAKHHPPSDPTTSYAGKTVLITGPNAGLGFEAATKFAALGVSSLIFGVRSVDKGEAAKVRIEKITRCEPDVIQIFQLDMSRYESVESFAKEVSSKYPRIDAAVLNAGLAPSAFNLSPEGWEMSLQVNVLSTAYLAILLLPKLRQTGKLNGQPTHLEFVASSGHGDVKIESVRDSASMLNKVNDKKNFTFTAQYIITKLFEMWAMEEVAAKTNPKEVIVLACCPGLCRSELGREFNAVLRGIDGVFKRIFGRSPEEGSRTLVSGTRVGSESHAGFWTHDRIATYVATPYIPSLTY